MCDRCEKLEDKNYILEKELIKLKKANVSLKKRNHEKQLTINKMMKRLRLLDPKQLYYNSQKGVRRK
jgi:hypothetical protein